MHPATRPQVTVHLWAPSMPGVSKSPGWTSLARPWKTTAWVLAHVSWIVSTANAYASCTRYGHKAHFLVKSSRLPSKLVQVLRLLLFLLSFGRWSLFGANQCLWVTRRLHISIKITVSIRDNKPLRFGERRTLLAFGWKNLSFKKKKTDKRMLPTCHNNGQSSHVWISINRLSNL